LDLLKGRKEKEGEEKERKRTMDKIGKWTFLSFCG
jgi:hypothetical protein